MENPENIYPNNFPSVMNKQKENFYLQVWNMNFLLAAPISDFLKTEFHSLLTDFLLLQLNPYH